MDLRSFEADGLRVEESERIAVVSLSTPPNRFTLALIQSLTGVVQELRTCTEIRCVWLRAEGADFSHGADLRDSKLAALVMQDDASRRYLAELGQDVIESWVALPMPTVVSCRGHVLGAGACLMAASSFRYATPDARCGFPEVGLGMSLSWGILPRLVREFGPNWTRRMVIEGEQVSMSELGSGSVRIVPADSLDSKALSLAKEIAEKPASAVRHTLELLQALEQAHQEHALSDARRFASTAGSDEFKEAVLRFLGAKE